jgi:hypothetical protein
MSFVLWSILILSFLIRLDVTADPFPLCKNVMESRNRPGVAQRFPGDLGSQISMTFGTWKWWGCQPHAPANIIPRKCSWYSFSLGAESTPGPWYGRKEMSLKNSVTPPGIDPGTVRLVAQRPKNYATPDPLPFMYFSKFLYFCISLALNISAIAYH